MSLATLCARLSIHLDADGIPSHCGEEMRVRVGLVGADWARCEKCGVTIGDVHSPHLGGGFGHAAPKWEQLPTEISQPGDGCPHGSVTK